MKFGSSNVLIVLFVIAVSRLVSYAEGTKAISIHVMNKQGGVEV